MQLDGLKEFTQVVGTLSKAAQECLEEREGYWGSEDSVRKNQSEYAALYDALVAYRNGGDDE